MGQTPLWCGQNCLVIMIPSWVAGQINHGAVRRGHILYMSRNDLCHCTNLNIRLKNPDSAVTAVTVQAKSVPASSILIGYKNVYTGSSDNTMHAIRPGDQCRS